MDQQSWIDDEVERALAEQREYAALGPLGRWRWRRERFGPPAGWRSMSLRSRRKCRREALVERRAG